MRALQNKGKTLDHKYLTTQRSYFIIQLRLNEQGFRYTLETAYVKGGLQERRGHRGTAEVNVANGKN